MEVIASRRTIASVASPQNGSVDRSHIAHKLASEVQEKGEAMAMENEHSTEVESRGCTGGDVVERDAGNACPTDRFDRCPN